MEVVGDQMEGNTMQRLADEIGEVTERGRTWLLMIPIPRPRSSMRGSSQSHALPTPSALT